jgi:hypothetical protein
VADEEINLIFVFRRDINDRGGDGFFAAKTGNLVVLNLVEVRLANLPGAIAHRDKDNVFLGKIILVGQLLGTLALAIDVDEFNLDVGLPVDCASCLVFPEKLFQMLVDLLQFFDIRIVGDGDDDLDQFIQLTNVGLRLWCERVGARLCEVDPAEIFGGEEVQ